MADPVFTSVRLGQNRALYVSRLPATWGTSATLSNKLMHSSGFPPIMAKPIVINDAAYAGGNPSMSPRKNVVIGYMLESNPTFWANHHAIHIGMAAVCGNDAVSAIVGSVYPHQVYLPDAPYFLTGRSFQDMSAANPDVNGLVTAVAATDFLFHGVAITQVVVSWQATGMATVSYKLEGIGGAVAAAGNVTEAGDLASPTFFLTYDKVRVSWKRATSLGVPNWDGSINAMGAFAIGAFPALETCTTPSMVDITYAIDKGSIRVLTGAGENRAGGMSASAGSYPGVPVAQAPQAFIDLSWRKDATTVGLIRDFCDQSTTDQGEYSIQVDFSGAIANEGSKFFFPLAAPTDNPGGGTGVGMLTHETTFQARKISGSVVWPMYYQTQNTMSPDLHP